ncbi:MFS transporter [Paraburkholderia sp. D1E]|uniref:MFS transporter n=1 Tax=Paraburkholderia sp. D1E TaxID=3461398 RepID=UPI0040460D9F
MSQIQRINVRSFIDERPLSRYQFIIITFIFLVIAFDGMDVGIMGFAAPEIMRNWGISKQEMGSVLSVVFLGVTAGALIAGPFGDRYGRKLVLVCSVFVFGSLTLFAARSADVSSLLVLRGMAGLGLGAALPNAVALMVEYAPHRKRSIIVTIVYSGFTAGAAASGLVAAWLMPTYGWQATLATAGILPIALAIVLAFALPESVVFLTLRKQNLKSIPSILKKIDRAATIAPNSEFWAPTLVKQSARPLTILLTKRYAFVTALLCLAYFMGVMATYIMVNWLPVIAKEAGFSLRQGAIITATITLGGPVGSICIGAVMDRMRPHWVLVLALLVAATFSASTSVALNNFGFLCIIMFALGCFFHGSMTGLQALSATSFPTAARATGVSCMHGIGRVGAICSGSIGATMMNRGWVLPEIFLALAVPMVISALAIGLLGVRGRHVRDWTEDNSAGHPTTTAMTSYES